MAALAQYAVEIPLASIRAGWWSGLGLGFTIVAVVVILAAMILTYAARIADQASEGIGSMDAARSNTLPVWEVQDINVAASGIWRSAQTARELLEKGGR